MAPPKRCERKKKRRKSHFEHEISGFKKSISKAGVHLALDAKIDLIHTVLRFLFYYALSSTKKIVRLFYNLA